MSLPRVPARFAHLADKISAGGGYSTEKLDAIEFCKQHTAAVLDARIPVRFAGARVDHPQVAAWVRRYLDNPAGCPSLVLAGNTGTGKTWLCWAALRAAVEGLAASGRRVMWRAVTHPDLNASQRVKADGSHNTALHDFMAAELLMLDDLGAGKNTDWTEDTLYRLVDYRWSHNLPTIYSTNLVPKQLVDTVGERVVSRLGDAVRVQIVGGDRRWVKA